MGGSPVESALRQGGRDPSLKLIETLGWDGTQAVRAARHLARLARSAALLGWDCDLAAAEAALGSVEDVHGGGVGWEGLYGIY
jgi:hypothetical protein